MKHFYVLLLLTFLFSPTFAFSHINSSLTFSAMQTDTTRTAILSGTVRSENDELLDSIQVTKVQTTPIYDSSTVITGVDGTYQFSIEGVILGINDDQNIEAIGQINFIPNNANIFIMLNKNSNVQLYISDILGKTKIITDQQYGIGQHSFDLNFIKNYANGIYILAAIIDGKLFANKVAKTDNDLSWGKLSIRLSNARSEIASKRPEENATIIIHYKDLKRKYYNYKIDDEAAITTNKDTTINMYLLTKKQLENPFVYSPLIPEDSAKTARDLVLFLYNAVYPGQKGSILPATPVWQAYLDSGNMPVGTEDSIRSAVNYMLNLTGIPPEQQWNEIQQYIQPGTIPQCVTTFEYAPSTVFSPPGVPFALGSWLSGGKVIEQSLIYNRDSLATENFGKATRIMMQKALMSTTRWVPDSSYFNYIGGLDHPTTGPFPLGPVDYPTADEIQITKYLIRMNNLNMVLYIGYDNLSEP